MPGILGIPNESFVIPLWEVNHSKKRLMLEEHSDGVAYKLGYEMNPIAFDETRMAYKNFSDEVYPLGNITDEFDYDPNLPVFLCMDFNRNPQSAVLAQIHGRLHVAFDEIRTENATTAEQAKNVCLRLKHWGIGHVYLYGDNTSNQGGRKGYGRVGKNDWTYVKEALKMYNIRFTSKLKLQNPKRKVRVDLVNNLIFNVATSEIRMAVHSRCKWLIRDYQESITDEMEGLKIDNGIIGHISDAFDYFLYWENKKSGMTIIGR